MLRFDSRNIALLLILFAVLFTYSNHFENSFHFDDSHSVVENPYIRDLSNLRAIFTDSRAFSTLPANRGYRPLVTASLALDYWMAGGLKPFWFHLSTFFWFALQLILMSFLFRALYARCDPGPAGCWAALFATALYGLHPVIAETVNYVIQRGDLYSTLGVVAAVLLYAQFPALRKFGIYLIPAALALLSKPPALVFPAVLFVYLVLFEERGPANALKRCMPAIVTALVFGWIISVMTPPAYTPGAASAFSYRITQPVVALGYFRSLFLPTHLSADTDRVALQSFDASAAAGFAFVACVIAVALWCGRIPQLRATAFGLWWFLLALTPTSFFPLAEVENDHRMFFPFVGLALALTWPIALWLQSRRPLTAGLRTAVAGICIILLSACAYGTRQRNAVWHSEESLWRDVTVKSPRNGRGLMNYGLTLMAKGDYPGALDYFERARVLNPNYHVLEINLGIANGGLNRDTTAEAHFARAIALAPAEANSHYFFGRWLKQKNRMVEAIGQLQLAAGANPDYLPSRYELLDAYAATGNWLRGRAEAESLLRQFPGDARATAFLASAQSPEAKKPTTPEDYLNLSLAYHRAGKFQDALTAAREALKLRPEYAEAYNNIAAAYEAMEMWDPAIEAATQALRIKPDFQLAKNNLAWSLQQKKTKGNR